MTRNSRRGKGDAGFQENFLNYIKWTLQVEQVEHDSLMNYGRWKGQEDLGRASFLIAQKALDWCLEDALPKTTAKRKGAKSLT